VIWLCCVFHVQQAWIDKLKQLKRPDSVYVDDFRRIRAYLFKTIRSLICPPGSAYFSLPEADFFRRAENVSAVLWGSDLAEIAELWDAYVRNSIRWAPHARIAALDALKDVLRGVDIKNIPSLIISNNNCESFFRHLKHNYLGGKVAPTVTEFFLQWNIHISRISIHCTKSGISIASLLTKHEQISKGILGEFPDVLNDSTSPEATYDEGVYYNAPSDHDAASNEDSDKDDDPDADKDDDPDDDEVEEKSNDLEAQREELVLQNLFKQKLDRKRSNVHDLACSKRI
jgi:hypothetical protein